MRERNHTVDIIKAIGLVLIILAHINPPKLIYNIRMFDVVLLVFASGLTLKNVGNNYFDYIFKRFKRLVLPTWIFLVIYFSFCYLLDLFGGNFNYSLKNYICSFAFINGGIDYVWIIRVYFLMALISPVIFTLANWSNGKISRILILTLGLIIINEAVVRIIRNGNNFAVDFFRGIVLYAFSYGIVEILACSVRNIEKLKNLFITVILFVIWIAMWIFSGYKELQPFKYPPQALYLLYGLAVSMFLYLVFCAKPAFYKGKIKAVIQWLSINSLTIYLCHIIPVTLIYEFELSIVNINFVLRYIFVIIVAVVLTVFVNWTKNNIFVRFTVRK